MYSMRVCIGYVGARLCVFISLHLYFNLKKPFCNFKANHVEFLYNKMFSINTNLAHFSATLY